MKPLQNNRKFLMVLLPAFVVSFSVGIFKYVSADSNLPEHGIVVDSQKCKALGRIQGDQVVAKKGTENKFQYSIISAKDKTYVVRERESGPNLMKKGECIIAQDKDFQNSTQEICCTEIKYQMKNGKVEKVCTKRLGIPTNQEGNLSKPPSSESCLMG